VEDLEAWVQERHHQGRGPYGRGHHQGRGPYGRLSKIVHPDKLVAIGDGSSRFKTFAKEAMQALNNSKEILIGR